MANWTITSYTFTGAVTVGITTGANAVLSGNAVFLEMDDTNLGGQKFRWNNLNNQFFVTWFDGLVWVTLGGFTDPNLATLYWQLVNSGISLTNLPIGPSNVYKQTIGVEANPRFQWDTNGKIEWGSGGASAVDTVLRRVLAATLQVT